MDDIERIYIEKEEYIKLYNEELAKRLKEGFRIEMAVEYIMTKLEDLMTEDYCPTSYLKRTLDILQGNYKEWDRDK